MQNNTEQAKEFFDKKIEINTFFNYPEVLVAYANQFIPKPVTDAMIEEYAAKESELHGGYMAMVKMGKWLRSKLTETNEPNTVPDRKKKSEHG